MSSIQISLVIASKQPQRLSEFYSFATNGDLQTGKSKNHYLIVHSNGMKLHVYRPSDKRSWPNRGRATSLCIQKAPSTDPLIAMKKWVTSLISRGATVFDQPTLETFGAESWMIDPEGNYFLILIPRFNI